MTQAQIFQGAWEDIANHAEQFKGRRNLTLIVPTQEPTENEQTSPEPRKFRDALEFLDSLPKRNHTPEDWERIEREIQEDRDSWE